MKRSILLLGALLAGGPVANSQAQQLSGAGATFPAPLYQRWAVEYNKQVPSIRVNYQSIGSGAGVKNFIQGVVDFGASDAAMTDAEMAKSPRGAVLVPQQGVSRNATGGATALVVGAENKAELRRLQLGRAVGNQWIVLDGLKPGDRLIVEGLQRVRPGQPVTPVAAGSAPAAKKG